MRRLLKLWRSFDRIPGLLAVPALWRLECGEDYVLLHPHLRPTDMAGSRYPCPHTFGDCPRKIIDYGDDEFAAICRDPHHSCETVPLTRGEALLHDLDLNGFFQPVLRAASIRAEPLRTRMPGVWTVGLSQHPATLNLPAFLVVSPTRAAFDNSVHRLMLDLAGPCLLVAPTNRYRSTSLQEQLQARHITYLCLEDRIGADENGTFVCIAAEETAAVPTGGVTDGPVERSVGSPAAMSAVREYMQTKAMTLTTLGNQFGTTDRTLRRFLKDGKMRRANFEAMAKAIGVTPEQLLRGELPASIKPPKRR